MADHECQYVYNIARSSWTAVKDETAKSERHELERILERWMWLDDDITVNAFPRSGTHLSWYLTRYILQGSAAPLADGVEASHYCTITTVGEGQKGPNRVISSHLFPAELPQLSPSKRKHIAIMRNPKDVAVSLYICLQSLPLMFNSPGTWDEFIHNFMNGQTPFGSWFQWVRAWEEFCDYHPEAPVLILHYEDTTTDWPDAVRRVASFLEVDLDAKSVDAIVAGCTLNVLKNIKIAAYFQNNFDVVQETQGENLFYRKGKVGDWKTHFTVKQNEEFDDVFTKKMAGSKLEFRFE